MASSRMKALQEEKKVAEAGGVDIRKGFLNQKVLDELGIEKVKTPEGIYFFAIVPPPDPNSYFGQRIHVHYHVGPADDTFLCPLQMWRERCPVCEERMRLEQSGGDAVDRNYLYSLRPAMRYLFFVVDMKDKETVEKGVQLWEAANTINQGIMSVSKNKRTGELIDISDPVEGKTLQFERRGKGATDTRYLGFSLEDREPLLEEWLTSVPDFDDILIKPSYDDIAASFFGEDGRPVIGEKGEKKEESKTPARQRQSQKEEPKSEPTKDAVDPLAPLIGQVDLTIPIIADAFAKWKSDDGSEAGLKALLSKQEVVKSMVAPSEKKETPKTESKKEEPPFETKEEKKEESKPTGKSTIDEIRAKLAARRAAQNK